jgi:xanthine dehydrogenase accessory factor
MHELIGALPEASAARSVGLVRVAGAFGLGARWPGQAALVTSAGRVVGDVLGGALDARLSQDVPALLASWPFGHGGTLLEFDLDRSDAERAGLPCGGGVTVLVQPFSSIPESTWTDVAARRPTGLLTHLDYADLPTTAVSLGASDRSPDGEDGGAAALADHLLRRGEPADSVVETAGGRVLVSVFVPRPHLVVVGSGGLASALDSQAALLGWTTADLTTAEDGVRAVQALGPGDGVLVIDHRGEVDFPILSEALRRGVGYVAALGSRKTQAARALRLREGGLSEEMIGRVRGPAGLNIGSRTPAEIAVAIVAEILSVRSAAAGGALRDGSGPINGPRL